MFESAELGQKVDKETYCAEEPKLREELLAAQHQLAGADFSVAVVVAGVSAAGKSEVVNLLHTWLDSRGIQTYAMGEPADEERERPPMWRFWRMLPPRGNMAILFGAWDAVPLLEFARGRESATEFDQALDRTIDLERMLSRENVLLVKLWLHLSRKQQKK